MRARSRRAQQREKPRMNTRSGLLLFSITILVSLSSCSWLQDYGHCACQVEVEADDGLLESITVNGEQVKSLDQREAENPL